MREAPLRGRRDVPAERRLVSGSVDAQRARPMKFTTIDDYIRALPNEAQPIARRVRATILEVAPEASEAIKYNMPSFLIDGAPFLYFAMWKKHIGMYPIYVGAAEFEDKIGPYREKKDTVRFLLDRPVPYDLIALLASFKRAHALATKKR